MQPADLAQSLCCRAGIALERPLPVDKLVTACLGPRAIRVADPGTLHGHTKLVRLGASWRVYVQRGIPKPMETRGVLRCLLEWELTQLGHEETDRDALLEAATEILEATVDFKSTGSNRGPARKASPRAAGGLRKTSAKRSRARTRQAG